MRELKMIIVPSETETQLWGRNANGSIRFRGTLPTQAEHTHALPRLLTALGSFLPVRAALVVPAREPSCATTLYHAWFSDVGGDGYELQIIGSARRERREWWGR